MRLVSMVLANVIVLGACTRGEVLPERPPRPPARAGTEPVVRIGIALDTADIEVGATTPFRIIGPDGRELASAGANQSWRLSVENGQIAGESGGGRFGPIAGALNIESRDGNVIIGGKPYRGSTLVRIGDSGKLSAVNILEMEEYLLGVVPYEIGRLQPNLIEAVKAQAIAARTYAVGNLGSRESRGFDFFATVADQVYGGVSGEDSVASRAVRETRGEILTHAGRPIIAYYSSTCGGRTASVQESWPWRAPQPYLQGVSDAMPGGDRAYCDTSSRYRWNVAWAGDALKTILETTLGRRLRRELHINRVETIEITGKSSSGRAESMRFRVDGETYTVPADSIRWVLQPDLTRGLNSSLLLDFKVETGDGQVQRVEVHGGGWGHGVGMCQVGAIGRARAGHSYRDILTTYYTDVEIERVY